MATDGGFITARSSRRRKFAGRVRESGRPNFRRGIQPPDSARKYFTTASVREWTCNFS